MTLTTVPCIDIAPYLAGRAEEKRNVARQVNRACEDIGFLVITGHGVDPLLCDRLFAVGKDFFDLPLAEKLRVRGTPFHGFQPVAAEVFGYDRTGAPGDLREAYSVGPVDVPDDEYYHRKAARNYFADNFFPSRPAGFAEVCTTYYRRMSQLAADLLRILAAALELREDFFAEKNSKPISTLRIMHYPEQREPPLPGQLRAGAHCDLGTLTILRTENEHRPGGLQVRNRHDEWVDVPAIPNSFVINLGDMMMRWTNDRWISTPHRVLNPPRDQAIGSYRMSIPFFHAPNYDSVIECLPNCSTAVNPPKYEPITCGQYLQRLAVVEVEKRKANTAAQ
jgi:isopenicillin N synthase-like dioxygenase